MQLGKYGSRMKNVQEYVARIGLVPDVLNRCSYK